MANSYCDYVVTEKANPVHRAYHDREYGFPISTDDELFERLVLEINQAGLSWETILKRRDGYKNAYCSFHVSKVAAFDEGDVERLMLDPGIIRNRSKILAAIHNAKAVMELQATYGSFGKWLESRAEESLEDWVKLFRQTFKFVGPEIVHEFLVSSGYLPGAHDETCPAHQEVLKARPWWMIRAGTRGI